MGTTLQLSQSTFSPIKFGRYGVLLNARPIHDPIEFVFGWSHFAKREKCEKAVKNSWKGREKLVKRPWKTAFPEFPENELISRKKEKMFVIYGFSRPFWSDC